MNRPTVSECTRGCVGEGARETTNNSGLSATAAKDCAATKDARPFVRLFWATPQDCEAHTPLAEIRSTLALVDTGADVNAIITRQELERLQMLNELRPLATTPQTSTLQPAGGGTIKVLGTVVLRPLVVAHRSMKTSHSTHRINLWLPPIVALVVDRPLAGSKFILGEKAMQSLQADLHRDGSRRKLVMRADDNCVTTIALTMNDWSAQQDTSTECVSETLVGVLGLTNLQQLQDQLMKEQQDILEDMTASQAACIAAIDLTADDAEGDVPIPAGSATTTQPLQQQPNTTATTPLQQQVNAAQHEAHVRIAQEVRAKDSEEVRARRLADDLEASFRKRLASEAEREEQTERANVFAKMRPHIDALQEHLQKMIDHRATHHPTTGTSTSAAAESKTPMFGDAVFELDADETNLLVDHMNRMAASTCLDPATVPRRVDAAPIPFRAVLQLRPEMAAEPPTRDGFTRVYTPEKMDAMRAQATQMLRAGVIEPAGATCRWAHAAVLVRKADGNWRFCVDYRPLNRRLEQEGYAVPPVDEICRILATDGGYYTRYDLKSAFWQIPMDESSRDYSAFYIPRMGLFRFSVLAFGLASATCLFQKNIEAIMAPLLFNGVVVYVDDLLVYAKTKAELLARMTQVQALLEKFDLRVAPNKCELVSTTIDVLGKRVSAGRVEANPDHLRAIAEFPMPQEVCKMREFLGMAGWHRQHLPNFANITAPLYALETTACAGAKTETGKQQTRANDHTPLIWTAEAEQAFEQLRRVLTSPPVVHVPSPNELDNRLRIYADAHQTSADGKQTGGVGGVLEWRDKDGNWRLVLAHSRKLTPAERNYTTTEVELLALVEVAKKSEQYLTKARNIQLFTDHQAIVHLSTLRDKHNSRLARWALWLSTFDADVVYKPGAMNAAADALSRAHTTNDLPIAGKLDELLRTTSNEESIGTNNVAAVMQRSRRQPITESHISSTVRTQMAVLTTQQEKFEVIVASPPWAYVHNNNGGHNRIEIQSLCSLPVDQLAADDAILLLWATGPKLEEAYRVVREWGFLASTIGFVYERPESEMVPGRYTNARTEFCVLGTKGEARTRLLANVYGTGVSQVVRDTDADKALPPSERAQKLWPEAFWASIEKLFLPSVRRLHVFGRVSRPGWMTLGNLAPRKLVEQVAVPISAQVAPIHESSQVLNDEDVLRPVVSGSESSHRPGGDVKSNDRAVPAISPPSSQEQQQPLVAPPPLRASRPAVAVPPSSSSSSSPPAAAAPPPSIVDVEHEQNHYEHTCRQNKNILFDQQHGVVLHLCEYPATRVILAKLVIAAVEERTLNASPEAMALMQTWVAEQTRPIQTQISQWTREFTLALDNDSLTWAQLQQQLVACKQQNREEGCKQWVLHKWQSNEWLVGKTCDELLALCASELSRFDNNAAAAAAAAATSNACLRAWSIRMERVGNQAAGGQQSTGAVRWLLPISADSYRNALIHNVHATHGHPGVFKTLSLLRQTGWHISRVKKHVTAVILKCMPCSRRKGNPKHWKATGHVPSSAEQAVGFNHRVHMDLIGPLQSRHGPRYILSFTDAFTRWPEAVTIASKDATVVARQFVRQWTCRYGPPSELISDQGTEFTAQVVAETAKLLGVRRMRTTPYHPQTNGLEERAHHTLSALITLLCEQHTVDEGDWNDVLALALFTMRTTVHRMTQHSPMRLVFGHEAALPEMLHDAPIVKQLIRDGLVDLAQQQQHGVVDGDGVLLDDTQRRRRLQQVRDFAGQRAADVQELWQRLFNAAVVSERIRDNMAEAAAARGPLAGIKPGDYVRVFEADVLMRDQRALNPKLEARRWSPPYRVGQVIRGAALILTLATDPLKQRTETGLRVKRIELDDALRRQYDELFENTQLDKIRQRLERRRLLEQCGWRYKDGDEEDSGVFIEEVLGTRGKSKSREAQVRWSDGSITWANYAMAKELAADACKRYNAKRRVRVAAPPLPVAAQRE